MGDKERDFCFNVYVQCMRKLFKFLPLKVKKPESQDSAAQLDYLANIFKVPRMNDGALPLS